MKTFDIIGGKVVIHTDALGIPCFKKIWDTYQKDDLATKYISYIVLKNKFDSPYVKSMSAVDIEPRLKAELFNNPDIKLPVEVLQAEQDYKDFNRTLSLQLLENARLKLESISLYYKNSLEDELDEKKVKDILAGMSSLGNTIKSLDALEASVKAGELANSKVRGGAEVNAFEIPR